MYDIAENDDHVICRATTVSGKAYELGYPKDEGYSKDALAGEISGQMATPEGFQVLNWVPGQEGYTSPGAEGIGIVKGYVSHDRGVIYSYRINFYNSKGWHFSFVDESGDVYKITTIRNGWHYIDYNSDKPIVVGVA
jgi:hypothetical protein